MSRESTELREKWPAVVGRETGARVTAREKSQAGGVDDGGRRRVRRE